MGDYMNKNDAKVCEQLETIAGGSGLRAASVCRKAAGIIARLSEELENAKTFVTTVIACGVCGLGERARHMRKFQGHDYVCIDCIVKAKGG